MPFPFGKDFAYTFYAGSSDEYEALPTAPESIYIYQTGYRPTRAEAAAGTDNGGLLQTISTWTDSGEGKVFSVDAIDDPDPTGSNTEHTYWVVVNFKLSTGEQTQTIIRALPMRRVWAHHAAVTTSKADLQTIFPKIDDYWNDSEQDASIELAVDMVKAELNSKGFEWALIWQPDKLNHAVAYKALTFLTAGELAAGADTWQRSHETWTNAADTALNTLRFEYDRYETQEPSSTETKGAYIRIMR